MRTRFAGFTGLRRILGCLVNRDTFAQVVEPTMRDMEFEIDAASTRWHRAIAFAAGCDALARVFVSITLTSPAAWMNAGVVLTLGLVGAALERWAFASGMDGRVVNSALLVPTFAAPLVFRYTKPGRGYWRLFVASVTAGMVPWLIQELLIAISDPTASTLTLVVVRLANGCAFSVVGAALGTAAVCPIDDAPFVRRALTGLAYAGLTTTGVFLTRALLSSQYTLPLATLRAPFFVMLFALILAVTCLPLVVIVRRWIWRRTWLAVIATAAVPLPVVAGAVIDGKSVARAVIECLPHSPSGLLPALPYLAGMATLGWLLGAAPARPGPNVMTP